jgi:hypothetical protein
MPGFTEGAATDAPIIERNHGLVTQTGANPLVYSQFSGCGRADRIRLAGDALTFSYASPEAMDPFAGLDPSGGPAAREEFLDAAMAPAVGRFGRSGVSLSLHRRENETSRGNVFGIGNWWKAPGGKLTTASYLALSDPGAGHDKGLAQRHKLTFTPFEAGNVSIGTFIRFATIGKAFEATRAGQTADRQSLEYGTTMTSGTVSLSLGFNRARDNIANAADLDTTHWQMVRGVLSWSPGGDGAVPDGYEINLSRADERLDPAGGGAATGKDLKSDLGLALTWTEGKNTTRIAVTVQRLDNRAAGTAHWRDRGASLSVTETIGIGPSTLTAALFGERFARRGAAGPLSRTIAGASLGTDLMNAGGAGLSLSSSVSVSRGDADFMDNHWRWWTSADVDVLRHLLARRSDGDLYLYGRLRSTMEHAPGEAITRDHQVLMSGGFAF